jgi:hypothetical protein
VLDEEEEKLLVADGGPGRHLGRSWGGLISSDRCRVAGLEGELV